MGDAPAYDTGFLCEYRCKVDEEQDDAYRSDMLRAFRLEQWDAAAVSETLDKLFARLRGLPGVATLLRKLRDQYPQMSLARCDDDRTMFQLLFCFDLFDKTHAAICDMLERGEMSDDGLEALTENV